jgi:hypothetical protein
METDRPCLLPGSSCVLPTTPEFLEASSQVGSELAPQSCSHTGITTHVRNAINCTPVLCTAAAACSYSARPTLAQSL